MNFLASEEKNQDYRPLKSEGVEFLTILHFFKGAWKISFFFGLAGIALSALYLVFIPEQYEARVQISMAQISDQQKNNSPMGINIEEPSLLISRMSFPTSFTPEAVAACGMQDRSNVGILQTNFIKLSIPKKLGNVVELSTLAKTPQLAKQCALAIFELISASQAMIAAPFIEEVQIKLADDEARLQKAKEIIARSDRSGEAVSASYLATRDEIRFLLEEITTLKSMVRLSQNRATRIVAPIYASDTPVKPKIKEVLVIGFLVGLFIGLCIVFIRNRI